MSRSDRIQKDLLRAARRAQRLAERARRRTDRQAERARKAASRAEDLARRAAGRTEDLYIDDPSRFDDWVHEALDRVEAGLSGRARRSTGSSNDEDASGRRRAYRARAKARRSRSMVRRRMYRDPDRAKIWGVCAGFADYLGVDVWKVRLGAVLGLIFIPQVTIVGYIAAYYIMDKKPYYRRSADRYDDAMDLAGEEYDDGEEEMAEEDAPAYQEEPVARDREQSRSRSRERSSRSRSSRPPRMSNATALRTARAKFADLEDRVRAIESHVTSSRFQLERELNKISGENRA